jgi:putative intracellular protease/amidase
LAPQSASWRTQVGPDRTRVKSSTVKRVRAFEARGKGIAGASNAGFPLALAAGGIFADRKVTVGPEGQNFAHLIAVVYRPPTGVFGRRFGATTWIKC